VALPEAFLERMRPLLSEQFDAFVASFGRPRTRGLRVNPAKSTGAELAELLEVPLDPVPWCPGGFAFPADVSLGGHPAHLAGLFYLQEPSSMAPAQALRPVPNAAVIDLAAAPGGKTIALASFVGPAGVVVANDAVPSRLRGLHDSLDLWGAANVVTVSRPVADLAADAAESFDAALLDAPCSGEALFRRNPATVREWSVGTVEGSARRQRQLLAASADLVRPGGALVYSTCTFETVENEDCVTDFLEATDGWTLESTDRLWPHQVSGEGQFYSRLVRTGTTGAAPAVRPRRTAIAGPVHTAAAWRRFVDQTMAGADMADGRLVERADRLFCAPEHDPGLPADMLARPGLPLGRMRPGRFEPHPALATALQPTKVADRVGWALRSPQLRAYLRGETVPDRGPDGWVLVCFERWGLGWARRSGGVLKNAFPAHLRRQARRWSGG
jgi:16S rRNA C967 or C1407 C5-methylase (RsmB/RsmF family)/NOL1/NOP2/fmu family ribosome biogenesis protein